MPSNELKDNIDGCKHYIKRCKIVSPCCNKIFWCRRCHDEETYSQNMNLDTLHKIDRYKIKEIVCSRCNLKQEVKKECSNCRCNFGKYFCNMCKFHSDDDNIFHCDKCGICRYSTVKTTEHCDDCGICINKIDNYEHKCNKKNIRGDNCPICRENLFFSTEPFRYLICGHKIHIECLQELAKNGYKCPLCLKSIVDISIINKIKEYEINNTIMPNEYKDKVMSIICNECCGKSEVPFHIVGGKCLQCNSYNTSML